MFINLISYLSGYLGVEQNTLTICLSILLCTLIIAFVVKGI